VKPESPLDPHLNERLAHSGFRFTPQRQHVYNVVAHQLDHPTTDEIFVHAKTEMPDISMATVYNCLDALAESGLLRQVKLDRGATRYCPNMQEHAHFYCDACGKITDIHLHGDLLKSSMQLPQGYRADHVDIAIHGACGNPECPGRETR
jgi:Fe2+ or Zn2+ uptake regulation protein